MKIGFWGAGKMAEGILQAMDSRKAVLMAERMEARAAEIAGRYGVKTTADVKKVAKECDIVFLAVRPQDMASVADEVRPMLRAGQTVVSIVAGKTIARLRDALGRKVGIIRVMPNLALRAGAGMCAICPARGVNAEHLSKVEAILGAAGSTVRLAERDFDAVTALSGSGPAYFAYMMQAMAEGGVKLGLKPKVARLLAQETMYGTAKFLRESEMDLTKFIDGVCTKGGTTAAGMVSMAEKDVFKKIVAATLKGAADRSRELA